MRRIVKIFVIALSPAIWSGRVWADQAQVTRDEVVRRVQKATTVPSEMPGLAAAQRDALMAHIRERISSQAAEVLPPAIECPNEQAVDRLTSRPFVFYFPDDRYIDLNISVKLTELQMLLKYEVMFPPLTDEQQNAVKSSVDPVVEAMRKNMLRLLVGKYPLFTASEIEERVGSARSILTSKIGDPDTYWLKVPLKAQDGDRLIADFNTRLEQSVDRIDERVKKEATDWQGNRDAKVAEVARVHVLDEITWPMIKLIEKLTTDPSREVDVSSKIAPRLHSLQRELFQLQIQLSHASTEPGGN